MVIHYNSYICSLYLNNNDKNTIKKQLFAINVFDSFFEFLQSVHTQ